MVTGLSGKGKLKMDKDTPRQGRPQNEYQVFVGMSFERNMNAVYENSIKATIEECGYLARRVDRINAENMRLDDLIEKEIKDSRFVIIDLTEQKSAVYFEAGYARGIGIDTIWTCRQDEMVRLAFNVRQFPFVAWSDEQDLKKNLKSRIEETFGLGPLGGEENEAEKYVKMKPRPRIFQEKGVEVRDHFDMAEEPIDTIEVVQPEMGNDKKMRMIPDRFAGLQMIERLKITDNPFDFPVTRYEFSDGSAIIGSKNGNYWAFGVHRDWDQEEMRKRVYWPEDIPEVFLDLCGEGWQEFIRSPPHRDGVYK